MTTPNLTWAVLKRGRGQLLTLDGLARHERKAKRTCIFRLRLQWLDSADEQYTALSRTTRIEQYGVGAVAEKRKTWGSERT